VLRGTVIRQIQNSPSRRRNAGITTRLHAYFGQHAQVLVRCDDGHRLAASTRHADGAAEMARVIVPRKTVGELRKRSG